MRRRGLGRRVVGVLSCEVFRFLSVPPSPPTPPFFATLFLKLFFVVESFGHWFFFSCCVRVMRTVNDFSFVFVFMILPPPPPRPLPVNLVCHAVVRYRCHLGDFFFFFLHFLSFFYSLLLWNINHYTCSSSACYNAFFFKFPPSPYHYPLSAIHFPFFPLSMVHHS